MIRVTAEIEIDEKEIHEEFIRSSGPGGQNVNKVATAVQLRFDVANSPSLSGYAAVRDRLRVLARGRMTEEGVLVIQARRFRTQDANRRDAVQRLVELIRRAAEPPKIRHKTRPTLGSKVRRLDTKRRRGKIKQMRNPDAGFEE